MAGEVAGLDNIVYILAGDVAMTNSTGAKIQGIDDYTYSHLCNLLDISQFGDSYAKRKAGQKDASIKLAGNYYSGDTNGQAVLVPGASVYVGAYPQGTGVAGTQIPAIVESVEYGAKATDKQTISVSIQGNGAPVALPLRP